LLDENQEKSDVLHVKKTTRPLRDRFSFRKGLTNALVDSRREMKKTRRPEGSAGGNHPQRGVSGRLNDCTVMMNLILGPEVYTSAPLFPKAPVGGLLSGINES